MGYHVRLEVISLYAGVSTLLAAERLFSRMSSHVSLEVIIPCAGVFTLIAAEKLFSSVNKHVPFQMRSISWWEGTHFALMGLLSSSLLGCLFLGRHFLPDTWVVWSFLWFGFLFWNKVLRWLEGNFQNERIACLSKYAVLQILNSEKRKWSQSYYLGYETACIYPMFNLWISDDE